MTKAPVHNDQQTAYLKANFCLIFQENLENFAQILGFFMGNLKPIQEILYSISNIFFRNRFQSCIKKGCNYSHQSILPYNRFEMHKMSRQCRWDFRCSSDFFFQLKIVWSLNVIDELTEKRFYMIYRLKYKIIYLAWIEIEYLRIWFDNVTRKKMLWLNIYWLKFG